MNIRYVIKVTQKQGNAVLEGYCERSGKWAVVTPNIDDAKLFLTYRKAANAVTSTLWTTAVGSKYPIQLNIQRVGATVTYLGDEK